MSGDLISYRSGEQIGLEEYLGFLQRSDLGSLYPEKRFTRRVERLLETASIVVAARRGSKLVGVCLGVTDFAYFLFVTDLGVDRDYCRKGIGRHLLETAIEAAGGPDDITAVTWSNEKALPFYAACGWKPRAGLVAKHARES
jgi:GNAT superfamily N-acetyltransferase